LKSNGLTRFADAELPEPVNTARHRDRYVISVTKYVESSEKDGIAEDKRHTDREAAGQQRRLTPPERINAMVVIDKVRNHRVKTTDDVLTGDTYIMTR